MAATRSQLERPLAFATGALGLATLLSYGGRWIWLGDLLVNFRTHLGLALVLLLAVALVARHGKLITALALLLAVQSWPLLGMVIGRGAPPPGEARPLRLVEFNVQVGNADIEGVAHYLDSLSPDVVVLAEVTAASAGQLAARLPRLPHHQLALDQGVRGVMLLSRWPLREPRQLRQGGVLYGVSAAVDLGDRRLRVHGVHLDWPVMPVPYEARNAQLVALGGELAACIGACVVVGDFNTTPWSSHFRDLERSSGFHDCAAGRGWVPSWPATLPALLRIRIDHCLVNDAVWVRELRVGASAGSDHFAMVNDLAIVSFSAP